MIDIDEALRYCGCPSPSASDRHRMAEIAEKLQKTIVPRYVYRVLPVEQTIDGFALTGSGMVLPGHSAEKMLRNCHHAAVLICTLGITFDTMLREWQHRSISDALLLDGCGSAYVEAGCGIAEEELLSRMPEKYLTDRFSPGYGDLPLSIQGQMLETVNATKRLGVTLLPSQLMDPVKTVSAIIGIADSPQPARIRGCAYCRLSENCMLRKRGKHCANGSNKDPT